MQQAPRFQGRGKSQEGGPHAPKEEQRWAEVFSSSPRLMSDFPLDAGPPSAVTCGGDVNCRGRRRAEAGKFI